MFTCSGVTLFPGSAEVCTCSLSGGMKTSKLFWGKPSGTLRAIQSPAEIGTQVTWRRQGGRCVLTGRESA